jgi:hypothetical protein
VKFSHTHREREKPERKTERKDKSSPLKHARDTTGTQREEQNKTEQPITPLRIQESKKNITKMKSKQKRNTV